MFKSLTPSKALALASLLYALSNAFTQGVAPELGAFSLAFAMALGAAAGLMLGAVRSPRSLRPDHLPSALPAIVIAAVSLVIFALALDNAPGALIGAFIPLEAGVGVLASALLLREVIAPRQLAGILFGMIGAGLIGSLSVLLKETSGASTPLGAALSALAAISYGFCIPATRVATRKNEPLPIAFGSACLVVLVSTPFALNDIATHGLTGIALVFLGAVLIKPLADTAYVLGTGRAPVALLAVALPAIGVFTSTFSWLFWGQYPDLGVWIGGPVLCLSAYLVLTPGARAPEMAAAP